MSEVTSDKEARAAAKGFVLRRPQPNELFLDLDDEDSCRVFWENLPIVDETETSSGSTDGVEAIAVTPSPSGEPWHFHVVVTMRGQPSPTTRIYLQAMLGSDRLHEALALRELARGMDDATVLFERPERPEPL